MQSNYNGDVISLEKETKAMIDLVLESTKHLDTIDLVNMSNVAGGPWGKVFDSNGPKHKQIISKEDIYNYYLNKERNLKQKNGRYLWKVYINMK